MISLLLISCAMKTTVIGTVDIAESKVCTVQLADDSIVELESKICTVLKEGDIIRVVRKK